MPVISISRRVKHCRFLTVLSKEIEKKRRSICLGRIHAIKPLKRFNIALIIIRVIILKIAMAKLEKLPVKIIGFRGDVL